MTSIRPGSPGVAGSSSIPTLPPRFVATLGDPRARDLMCRLWNWAATTPEPTVEVLKRMGFSEAAARTKVIAWDRSWAGGKVNKAPKPLYEFTRFVDVVRHEFTEKNLQLMNELIGGRFTEAEYSSVNHFTYNAAFGSSTSFVEAGLAGVAYDGLLQGTYEAWETPGSPSVATVWQRARYNWSQAVGEDLEGARAGSMARRQFRPIQSMEPAPTAFEPHSSTNQVVGRLKKLVKRRDFAAFQQEVEAMPDTLRQSVRQRALEIFESLDGRRDLQAVGVGVSLLHGNLVEANLFRHRSLKTLPELTAFKAFADAASKDKNLAFVFESELRKYFGDFPPPYESMWALEMIKGGASADVAYFRALLQLNSDTLAASRNLALEFLNKIGPDRRKTLVQAAAKMNLGTEQNPRPFNLKDEVCAARELTPAARARIEQLLVI